MAKVMVYACLLVVVIISTSAAQERRLLQDSGLFNCGGIKQIGKSASDNRCCPLCWCIGELSDKKMLARDNIQQYCRQECGKCVAAGYDSKQCPSDNSKLPEVCSKGLQFSNVVTGLVNKCLDEYRSNPGALSKAKGC